RPVKACLLLLSRAVRADWLPEKGWKGRRLVITAVRMSSAAAGGGSRETGSAKATVADQICQAVVSTSNLLHLMQESSPSQAQLMKLTKNLLAKAAVVKNTGQVLEHLPRVISSLDAYMDSGLKRLVDRFL
ncbi:hypothetical protein Taro_006564, partial [Colocasia esculenta]|nr:hypothetical protein [Colocasia esculenta]